MAFVFAFVSSNAQGGAPLVRAPVQPGPHRRQHVRCIDGERLQAQGWHAFDLLGIGRGRLVLAAVGETGPTLVLLSQRNAIIEEQQQQSQQLGCRARH